MVIGENKIITYFSKNVNLLNKENIHLSIEISPKNISYCLLNIQNLKFIFLKSVTVENTNELINQIGSENDLKLEYSSSCVSYKNFPTTLIPNELFDKEKKHLYLDFLCENTENIKLDISKKINCTAVYSIEDKLSQTIQQIQPNIKEKNSTIVKICQLIKQYSHIKEKTAFLFVYTNKININIIEKESLIFQNYFKISNETDVLYFILFCFEQLNLDPNSIELYLFGNIERGDENYSLLYKYIRNIKFGSNCNTLSFSEELKKVSNHKFFSLFSQVLCE